VTAASAKVRLMVGTEGGRLIARKVGVGEQEASKEYRRLLLDTAFCLRVRSIETSCGVVAAVALLVRGRVTRHIAEGRTLHSHCCENLKLTNHGYWLNSYQ
jgi:hypothetical protein